MRNRARTILRRNYGGMFAQCARDVIELLDYIETIPPTRKELMNDEVRTAPSYDELKTDNDRLSEMVAGYSQQMASIRSVVENPAITDAEKVKLLGTWLDLQKSDDAPSGGSDRSESAESAQRDDQQVAESEEGDDA